MLRRGGLTAPHQDTEREPELGRPRLGFPCAPGGRLCTRCWGGCRAWPTSQCHRRATEGLRRSTLCVFQPVTAHCERYARALSLAASPDSAKVRSCLKSICCGRLSPLEVPRWRFAYRGRSSGTKTRVISENPSFCRRRQIFNAVLGTTRTAGPQECHFIWKPCMP